MDLTTEIVARFVGGQLELQSQTERYLYRGEIDTIVLWGEGDDSTLQVALAWLAESVGFPSAPSGWVASYRLSYSAKLSEYRVTDIGPSSAGEDSRLYLVSTLRDEAVVLYPPGGSKLDPGIVEGLQLDQVTVIELNKLCNFPIVRHGTGGSSTCNDYATSLVLLPDAPRFGKKRRWRCDRHMNDHG